MRTAHRNIIFLYKALEQIDNTKEIVESAIKRVGTVKEIDTFFDKFTIAFAKWLLDLNERTREHSIEELLEAYRDYLLTAPDDEQIDYKEERSYTPSNWCESCGGRNCIC